MDVLKRVFVFDCLPDDCRRKEPILHLYVAEMNENEIAHIVVAHSTNKSNDWNNFIIQHACEILKVPPPYGGRDYFGITELGIGGLSAEQNLRHQLIVDVMLRNFPSIRQITHKTLIELVQMWGDFSKEHNSCTIK